VSLELIERAADALGRDLLQEVAFLGAAALPLWITEDGAPPSRATRDVDVIVEVVSLVGYYDLGDELRERSFSENPEAKQICAWKHTPSGLELDVMPTEAEILGFSNRWYGDALRGAVEVTLPSGTAIRAVPPPYFLGTKLEAFKGRGRDAGGVPDYLGSRDFGDIVSLIDGRAELVDEVRGAPEELRLYIADEFTSMQEDDRFDGGVAGALMPDNASQARRPLVLGRIEELVAAGRQ
jgi:hypothetical protein